MDIWPKLPGIPEPPIWDGKRFRIGQTSEAVLCYHGADSNWSNSLTQMHEENAGRDHPIDMASRRRAIEAIAPALTRPRPAVLEVGCSSGYFLEDLRRAAPHAELLGSDFIVQPLRSLAERLEGVPLVQFDVKRCPLADCQFDAVVCLNVLEHIDDDELALQQMYRVLKPGGLLALEVPAGPSLYDFYDRQLMHFRRYANADLHTLVQGAGFEVARSSHLGFSLYPAFWLVKKRNRLLERRGKLPDVERRVAKQISHSRSNLAFKSLIGLEMLAGRILNYPLGIRCILTLRRPLLSREAATRNVA